MRKPAPMSVLIERERRTVFSAFDHELLIDLLYQIEGHAQPRARLDRYSMQHYIEMSTRYLRQPVRDEVNNALLDACDTLRGIETYYPLDAIYHEVRREVGYK